MLGLLFGMGLIAGAELARRSEDKVRDPRVAQSLAGAGIGGLYAAVLAAANLYGLVGPGAAFAGLAAITSFAMVLAMRFGVPCAVLGLVGGLATPAVVQSSAPSVPLLAGYLAIVIGSLTLLSRRQRWVWLGIGALVGGAGWSLALIVLGGLDISATLSLGLLMLLLGLGLPALSFDRHAVPISARRRGGRCRLTACAAGSDRRVCAADLGTLRIAVAGLRLAQGAHADAAEGRRGASADGARPGGALALAGHDAVRGRDRWHRPDLRRLCLVQRLA
jgi:uncharacterized membrane protein